MAVRYWIVKSEPELFSIQDLENSPDKVTCWDGVRNYQARNYIRDEMKLGDQVLFYHSNCETPAITGLCEISAEGYADFTALDPNNPHYYFKSSKENPVWYMVDIKFKNKFSNPVTLSRIRGNKLLLNLKLIQPGNRLSVMPLDKKEFEEIIKMSIL